MNRSQDDPEYESLKAQDFWEKRRFYQNLAHPDCRDPDHAGCDKCTDDEDE